MTMWCISISCIADQNKLTRHAHVSHVKPAAMTITVLDGGKILLRGLRENWGVFL